MADAIEDSADTGALAAALEGMSAPPPKPAAIKVDPLPDTTAGEVAAAEATIAADPVEGEEVEGAEQEAGAPEPEYEIEVEGVRETIRGEAAIKEALQKAIHYSRNSEQNARVREALIAQAQVQENNFKFQQAIVNDVTQLSTVQSQLEQYNQIDWAAAFDSDPFNAMKLKEQRDQLRENYHQRVAAINGKQQQFQQGQAQAAQQLYAAESAALVAKLPEWRNSEKAQAEKAGIVSALATHYGFNEAEIGSLLDHRMVMVARDAAAYRALQAGKADRIKEVRTAPPVSKPGGPGTQTNSRTEFTKTRIELRRLGQKGNSHAQSAIAEKLFSKAFK